MKKSLIAVAGASVAAAAMPVMGVFAATTTTSFTDVVTVNVGKSCTIIPENGAVVTETTDQSGNTIITLPNRTFGPYTLMQGHYISNIGGNQIAEDTDDPADDPSVPAPSAASIQCSTGTGAVAPGSGAQAAGSWVLTAQGNGGTAMTGKISSSNTIETGDATDWAGTGSVWQYKVVGSDSATAYDEIPTDATTIAASSTSSSYPVVISPRYRVKASAGQTEDTYTGKVTYTLIYANN